MINPDPERILRMGHRDFVGGDGVMWEQIAELQLSFLKNQGLKESHKLLDIACGSLRAGRLFIEYLNAGNYLALEKEINLLILGVAEEIGSNRFKEKAPEFVVSANFEFDKFSCKPDYAIAQSLFTHLTLEDIYRCLCSLKKIALSDLKFFATFFESEINVDNPNQSDSLDCFFYTKDQIEMVAYLAGWEMFYIGEWGHPRNQKMLRLAPR
jgi:SAM-dependent methyltransferase